MVRSRQCLQRRSVAEFHASISLTHLQSYYPTTHALPPATRCNNGFANARLEPPPPAPASLRVHVIASSVPARDLSPPDLSISLSLQSPTPIPIATRCPHARLPAPPPCACLCTIFATPCSSPTHHEEHGLRVVAHPGRVRRQRLHQAACQGVCVTCVQQGQVRA